MAELNQALDRLVRVEEDLDIAISRQARLAENTGGGRPAERPLPFHWSGAEAHRQLVATVTRWARELAADAGWVIDLDAVVVPPPPRHARANVVAVAAKPDPRSHVDEVLPARHHDDPATLPYRSGPAARAAHWIRTHQRRLRAFPDLGALTDELLAIAGLTQHVIDRAPTRWYIGLCDLCDQPLYARPDSALTACRNLSCPGENGQPIVYRVAERRAWLLDAARDYMVTAAEASRAVPLLVHPETGFVYSTFRSACGTDALPADRTHPDGHPRYRLGDCIAWAEAREQASRLPGRHAI